MSRTVLRGRVDEAACVSAGEPAGECGEDMVCGLLWSVVEMFMYWYMEYGCIACHTRN